MSGGEPSSIKQFSRCAAGMPVLSRAHLGACKSLLDFRVYGLTLRVIYICFDLFKERRDPMEHMALYRKYRPRSFDDVYGQDHITSVLKYESAKGRLSHAYLFCGPRGTGKTTCAKILAKAVNCDDPVNGDPCGKCFKCTSVDDGSATDVVEMDAASNTGVDYIRDIRDEVAYTPAFMNKRVYIIDEVHMLSIGAFNALLKTLEEPPEHVLFILATTEQHKLPATIISRCQRFDFRRITVDDIVRRLMYIADAESIPLEKDAAILLAKQAQGGMRDAINLFELCAGGGHDVTAERVSDILGITGMENASNTAFAVKRGDHEALFRAVAEVTSSSKDVAVYWQELISFWRDMLVAKSVKDPAGYLDLTVSEWELLKKTADAFTTAELIYQSNLLDETLVTMNRLPQIKRNLAEMTLIKMSSPDLDASADAVMARLALLEDKVKLMGAAPRNTVKAVADEVAPEVKTEPKAEIKAAAEDTPKEIKTQLPTPKAQTGTSAWRKVADKGEFIDKIASLNPILRGFVKGTECFVSKDRSRAILRVPNSFTAGMLSEADSMATLTDALVLAGLADVGVSVKIEVGETETDEISLMDEIEEF